MLLLLHSAFILSVVKLLKGGGGVCALNSHGNYIVVHGKSWKNHGIVFFNFFGNLVMRSAGSAAFIQIHFRLLLSRKQTL